MAAGLALIAAGLWQISGATAGTTFAGTVLGMVLLGAGAELAIPTATGSVIGSVPASDSGVASATNTTALHLGGALAVAGRTGGATGELLTHVAKTAFVNVMDLSLLTGSAVAMADGLLVLLWLPGQRSKTN
jgi:hypothetical protein